MLEILQFVLSGFWRFAGALTLLSVATFGLASILSSFANILHAIRRRSEVSR